MTAPPPPPLPPEPVAAVPEPLVEEASRAAPAGLFGAAVPAGEYRFVPHVVVTINGEDLRPSLTPGVGVVVVDGVRTTWGRAEVLDQPDPATGQLQLFDTTGTWVHDQRRPGQTVSLRWEGLGRDGSLQSQVYYRGRIGDPITVSPKTVTDPVTGDPIQGVLITLPLVSVLVDLANLVQRVDWPAETLFDRAQRVQNIAIAAGVLNIVLIRPFWRTPQVAPVAAADQVSILEHLTRLFDSCGADRMTYAPNVGSVEYVARKHWGPGTRGTAQLNYSPVGSTTAKAGKGIFALPYLFVRSDGGALQPSMTTWLDGRTLEYDPADGVSQPARITRVSVTGPDQADNYDPRTVEVTVPGSYEAVNGTRTAHLDSDVAWNAWNDLAASDVASMVAYEGTAWRLQPVRLVTRKTGGFESLVQAKVLLQGGESDSLVFLQHTWLPSVGIRPVFGIQGATIGYASGGWELDLDLAPMTTESPQHAITWDEVDDGSAGYQVQWWDTDTEHGIDSSLTYEDCGHIATGVGVAVAGTGPNVGYFDA